MRQTRYAGGGDGEIAYQVIGTGPADLLYIPGQLNHIESTWEEPIFARHLERLSSFSRLILFDKRGTGLSERLRRGEMPSLETRVDDACQVLDAAGVERASIFATADGVPTALLMAATFPDRVSSLIVYAASARWLAAEDYPEGIPGELVDGLESAFDEYWGNDEQPLSAELLAPSRLPDERWRRSLARMQRMAGNPRSQHQYFKLWASVDVRDVLRSINVPTLVMGCTGDLLYPIAQTRYVAERIDGARYFEFSGTDHAYWSQNDAVVANEIEEFITGARHADDLDRVLATVLFTDIVGSTEIAAEVGDRRWAELVEAHHAVVRRQLERFRGREVDTAGDGFFATFDGPARAIRCAEAIGVELVPLDLRIRAGLHTGECEIMDNKIGGIAVNVGARVAGCAGAGEILVSRTVVDLVAGSGIRFHEHGERELKGIPGVWTLYRVDVP